MTLSEIVPIASATLALASTAGMGLQWGALKALRDRRDDLNEEAEARDKKLAKLESYRAADQAKIAQLESDLKAITAVANGEVHWTVIEHQLQDHHTAAQEHWTAQEQTLKLILDELRKRGTL